METLTGEPLIFTKALVLLTDRFIGGFGPGGLETALLIEPVETGGERFLTGEGVRGFFGEKTGLGDVTF